MRSGAWWSRSPATVRRLDLAVCMAVVAVGVGGQIAASAGAAVQSMPLSPVGVVLAVAAAATLWWRRTRPIATVVLGIVVLAVAGGAREPGLFAAQGGLVVVLACFALGAWNERDRWTVVVGTVLVVGFVAGSTSDGNGVLPATAAALALIALPVVAGLAARSRRRYLEEVERRLADAEDRQDERARLAIQEERTRIARELHDVVAHHASLIGVQAGAARSSLGSVPEVIADALAAIERSSRAAVGEMRQIVDVLRPTGGDDGRSPQPGLGQLDDLAARWQEAGYDLDLAVDVDQALPPAMALTAYRIVEEAVTNVARHSQARCASISVRSDGGRVQLVVEDPGPARGGSSDGGRGLVGMAERCAVFGGGVTAEPTSAGGFRVHAEIPVLEAT